MVKKDSTYTNIVNNLFDQGQILACEIILLVETFLDKAESQSKSAEQLLSLNSLIQQNIDEIY